ncbi:response regulator [Hansschlegelia quercus]|uniref:histidine kinase n=1 Tax=Hansschlegelia quercus TaxID=2528245 RepID=A0A4Q9GHY3_9HYPH|nr:response regulator [Hansschlegelia quercus]TBN53793.1 response regulator [Hansschlegelia quercus]
MTSEPRLRDGSTLRRHDGAVRPLSASERKIEEAAHEIRTPLGGLLALADLLLAEDLTDAARGHAEAMKDAARHLFGVATTLLGGAETGAASLGMSRFLDRTVPPIAARAAVQSLSFQLLRGPGVPERVTADESWLRQIIDNLADNALRATRSGGIELAVDCIGEDANSALVRFAIRDTGPGLGDDPKALFARYAQGDEPGAAGIGLSLVARLAHRMSGRLEAANRPEGGAEVAAVVRLATQSEPVRHAGAQLKILIAEDNIVNQRVVATILNQFGHDYDIVGDGEAAVAAASTGAYDLVLMDAAMPHLDGLRATRRIRSMDTPAADVRIVGVTARAFAHEIADFIAAGADAVVTKPISIAELWRVIGADVRKAG